MVQIYLKYLLDYPLGKKLKLHLEFVVAQLRYEQDTGRESVLEMLAYIFQTFPQVCKNIQNNRNGILALHIHNIGPVVKHCFFFSFPPIQKILLGHSALFFAPLALVVVNDDSARCKKMAAMAIKTLLTQLDSNNQNTLFSIVSTWLNAEKVHTKTLYWFGTHLLFIPALFLGGIVSSS